MRRESGETFRFSATGRKLSVVLLPTTNATPLAAAVVSPVAAPSPVVAGVGDELLACCPTPVFRHDGLFIKNDGQTGLTYGGNKARKLAPLFERLQSQGYQRLVTVGGAGSHHVLATALFAKAAGLRCAALLVPQVHTDHAAKVLRLVSSLDIDLYPCFSPLDVARALFAERGTSTAWAGPGAMGATAAGGYELAFDEWVAQRPALDLQSQPELHVVAAGSGGTAAGLLAGMSKHRLAGRVVAVAVANNPLLRATILGQAWGIERRQGRPVTWRIGRRLIVDTSAIGRGYGYPSADTSSAIDHAAHVGLHLEHTYTAKAYAVAKALARAHPEQVVVFWQTVSQRPLPQLDAAPPLEEVAPALRRLLRAE